MATPASALAVRRTAPPNASSHLWMHGRAADLLLGWCWLPIGIGVHLVEPHLTAVQAAVGVIFLISFAHQPLTLGLVYGDPVQRQAHRRLYALTPFIAFAAIVVGLNVSLGAVALMAGLWNAEHTLMQRYGVMRIYGRKAGDQHGALEKPMFIVWLVAGLAFIGAYVDLDRLVDRLGLGATNRRSVNMLKPLHTPAVVLFWLAIVLSVALTARWWRAERAIGSAASRPKHWYALGTLGLVVLVMVDPIAGVAGYVAAHAIEYFAVVHTSLRKRQDRSPVAVLTNTRLRRTLVYTVYFSLMAALVASTWNFWGGRLYSFAILFFGALHILYDGFVWKLRRPAVAASLGIVTSAP